MTKLIAPNSCAFCERMRRNRKIRKGFAMTDVIAADKYNLTHEEWLTHWVCYYGTRRVNELGNGQKFKVVNTGRNSFNEIDRVAFDAGIYGIQWSNVSALIITEPPKTDVVSNDAASALNFLEPHKATLDTLDAEIKRYEEKIKELRAARAVIASL